jgi:hypothetical protein
LTVAETSKYVPAITDWYVFVEADYPIGRVHVRPAEEGGLHDSFRHMERNDATGLPWRKGAPCLDRPGRWLGSRDLVEQPTGAAFRIRWHVERALEWLCAAAQDALTGPDEPFELPKFPFEGGCVMGFDEDAGTFTAWKVLLGRCGEAFVKPISRNLRVAYAFSCDGNFVNRPRWGSKIRETEDLERAYWIALRGLPVFAPWNVAATWGQLRTVARAQKIDLDAKIRWLYHQLHTKNVTTETHLLVGCPIPEVYDGPQFRMHWQWVTLPAPLDVSSKSYHVRKGRKISAGAWSLERYRLFGDDQKIRWRESQCWAEDRLAVRGSLCEPLRRSRVIILGAGALGSAVAQFLVREGVYDVVICDGDTLEVANLRRHTSSISLTEFNKAIVASVDLNAASPFANVRSAYSFPLNLGSERSAVQEAEVVIDCTANDDVIARLETFDWAEGERWFFSGSLGVDARRLFCFVHRGTTFPAERFFDAVRPHLNQERELLQARDPKLLFAAGCWNPVFPSRWDDISALAAEMVKVIDNTMAGAGESGGLVIVER